MNASVFSPDPQCVVVCFFAASPTVELRLSVVRLFYRNLCGFYPINTGISYRSQGVFL